MAYSNLRALSPFRVELHQLISSPLASSGNTSGHEVLLEDRRAETVPDATIERLSLIIEQASNNLPPGDNEDPEIALNKLYSIEHTLTTNNFVCSIPWFLVPSLAQGLELKPLQNQQLIFAGENRYRRAHIEKNINQDFSHVDCDLSSLVYLSISETIGLPICFVEVPGHNFIRWNFTNGKYINWDTNFGYNRFTDDEYARMYGAQKEQIDNGTYLSNMTKANVLGYFGLCRGGTLDSQGKIDEAISEYYFGLENYPQSPVPGNVLAWKFVSSRRAQQIITPNQALELSRKACSIFRSADNLDTLACVLAEHGEFEEAIAIETEAYQLDPRTEFKAMIDAFKLGQTWLDING
ncbi:hypothetical protein [Metapseudomonas resinovorans]|uniref:Uncharacterized protein n=1 Tax=Metapseudomonas resinovorans NBRC 106553 TaxID=1245471 RepID=S6AT78_METRE|nr:hypothetical protein [Pseudomonas resinovorans]BAN49318.1 hypothetical protein PCA10_35860 [Pseudomonas resinovorans NBRC 106553]